VSLLAPVDYETGPRQYDLNLTLCDAQDCRYQELIINVSPVDEPPTLQVLQIASVSEAEVSAVTPLNLNTHFGVYKQWV
jgi:hypothetical protein